MTPDPHLASLVVALTLLYVGGAAVFTIGTIIATPVQLIRRKAPKEALLKGCILTVFWPWYFLYQANQIGKGVSKFLHEDLSSPETPTPEPAPEDKSTPD